MKHEYLSCWKTSVNTTTTHMKKVRMLEPFDPFTPIPTFVTEP